MLKSIHNTHNRFKDHTIELAFEGKKQEQTNKQQELAK